MKVEDISNGYSVIGPKCEPLEQNQKKHDNLDNLYNYDDYDDYEEYSGDSKESIYDNEYDDSDGFDEESRSPRDLDNLRQALLNALLVLTIFISHHAIVWPSGDSLIIFETKKLTIRNTMDKKGHDICILCGIMAH